MERNVTAVAMKMHLSQPAVTIRLGKLRKHFKDKLLVRTGNKMVLTKKAQSLIQPLKRATEEFDSLFPQHDFDPYKDPTAIDIHISEYCEHTLLDVLLTEIYRYNPEHEVYLHIFPATFFIHGIHDFTNAEVVMGAITDIAEFEQETVLYDEIVVLFKHFPISDDKLTAEKYFSLPHVALGVIAKNYPFTGQEDKRNIIMRVSSLNTAIEC